MRRILLLVGAFVTAVATLVGPIGSAQAQTLTPTPVKTVGFSGHAGLYGWGAATMLDGSVLVGDYWNYRVLRYNKDGSLAGVFIANEGNAPEQHQSPYGLGVDPGNGDVYMADTDQRNIDRYDENGNFLLTFGSAGTGIGKFRYPSRVAVATDHRAFVIDTWDNVISAHDPSGAELFHFGGTGTGDGQFKQPHGAAFDAADRLFVADSKNYRIQVFDSAGHFLYKWGTKGAANGQFVGDMRGLAIDKVNGWVYVVDAAGNRINKFDLAGNFLLRWGSLGTGPGQFSDGGREATVDGDGNLWVGDMPNFRTQKFSPTGTYLTQVPSPAEPPPVGGFNGPRGVAVDADGNMFVSDTYNWRMQKLSPDGNPLAVWGSRGRGDYKFNYTRLNATDPRNGDVVIADTDNHQIKKYDNNGTFKWAVGGFGKTPGLFKNPHGVDIGPDGRIYVADTNNKRVQILNEFGAPLLAFGSDGTGTGQFKFPKGINIANDGTIWVSDAVRANVQHFSNTGVYAGTLGGKGLADNQLQGPFDVESDSEYVFVADVPAHKIKVWRNDGTFVMAFGGRGQGLGKLNQPQGMDLTPSGQLYVTEQGNERVQIWSLYGSMTPP